MTQSSPNHRRIIVSVVIGVLVVVAVVGAALFFSSVSHLASGQHETTITIDVDFDKFRQIMVRKNATAAIVEQSGMEVLDEQIHDLDVDTSDDDHPLLNAIRGKSKSKVDGIKQLTVRLDDPAIDADELVLRQVISIRPDSMEVSSTSKSPAGNLEDYQTKLKAWAEDGSTIVELTTSLKVRVEIPSVFTSRADSEVRKSAEDAVKQQAESIRRFIAEHADKRMIFPDLGGKG